MQVLSVLQNIYYSINPLNWPLNDTTSFQASIYIGDPNPGTVMITWDFGDGTVVSRTSTGTEEFQQINIELLC